MAPRPGGEADKIGNRYEAAWAIRHALYCLRDARNSITVEDITAELGDGSEFTYVDGGVTRVYQVKRQRGNSNSWNISSLVHMGIFAAARTHVAAGREFHFVSMVPCGPLRELADRARSSTDLSTFIQSWLTVELEAVFDQVSSQAILESPQIAWETLRGMRFEVQDEDEIVRLNRVFAEVTLEGSAGHLMVLALGDVLLNNLGKTMRQSSLLHELDRHGIRSISISARESVRDQVRGITSTWLQTVRLDLLRPVMRRAEAGHVADASPTLRLAFLTGSAGSGKSAVLEQAVEILHDSAVTVLALRLDRIEHFGSTLELGRQLGLDVSPVTALALAAEGGSACLVIDQLDAVSLVSGRVPQRFDVVLGLIAEALAVPNMRVILACREFDVQNDYRLRSLAKRPDLRRVQVELLSHDEVKTAVREIGFDPSQLTPVQIQLLQTPLHLVLLSGIAAVDDALSFTTKGALFAAFWERKMQSARARRDQLRFNETIARVAHAVSERQTLSVPMEVLDSGDLIEDANVLVSEHVLARNDDRIAFFHEAFFDYAFARQWASGNEAMLTFLAASEQELFRRAQVRQILHYLHGSEPARFRREVESVLTASNVRFHIKEAVITVVADLHAPTAADAETVLRIAATNPPWNELLWHHLGRSPWFRRLRVEGTISCWLDSGRPHLEMRAITFMRRAAAEHGDDVVQLLQARRTNPAYPEWARHVFESGSLHTNRPLFDLFLSETAEGLYSGHEAEMWLAVRSLGKQQTGWALEIVAAQLAASPNAAALDAQGRIAALTTDDYWAKELVRTCAASDPSAFVQAMVPYLLGVMTATGAPDGEGMLIGDRHFRYRYPNHSRYQQTLGEILLSATETALRAVAQAEPERIRPVLETLASAPYETAQFLLYRTLTHQPVFADWSAELLLQGAHRLQCGYVTDPYWVAREVVHAISPFVNGALHRLLEEQFRDLHDHRERRPYSGRTAFTFLSALDETRLSKLGVRRLQEYRRKFGEEFPAEPEGIKGGSIQSPISADAVPKMTDHQWIRAMETHSVDGPDWGRLRGGARELGAQLTAAIPTNVPRFARLALKIDASTNCAYSEALLAGFGAAPAVSEPDEVFNAIRHIASWGRSSDDRWIGTALSPYLRQAPLDLVEIVLERVLHSSNPAGDRQGTGRADTDDLRSDTLILSGMDSARGSLVESLGNLLVCDVDGQRTELVRPYLEHMAGDPTLSVRSCVAHTVAASLRHARPTAYSSFKRLLDGADDLLATPPMKRLMVRIGTVDPSVVEPVVRRMLRSEVGEVRVAGGELAAFAALEWDSHELLELALRADGAVRLGVAQLCVGQMLDSRNAKLAANALTELFKDSDEDVRQAASALPQSLRGEALQPHTAILQALIDSPSFAHALPQLFITLQHAPDRIDSLVTHAASRFLTLYSSEVADIRTSAAGHAHYLSELAVRGLAQSEAPAHRKALLDIVDRLMEFGVHGVDEAVAAFERP